jgi:UDP-N-acetylmuramoyl-L-alanyl-D-glutamate--2,6-diaminopimelate ligase
MMSTRVTRLRALLHGVVEIAEEQDRELSGLAIDSRAVGNGDCFIAFPGVANDGRRFIADAVGRGAAAVLYEPNGFEAPAVNMPCLGVPQLRDKLGAIADRFYGAPSRRLTVIGVTGTNGKTTCTQLLAQALDEPDSRCAIIGTLGYGFPGALNTSLHTTPDAVTVHRLLDEFSRAGATHAAMEVSSHALDQGRVNAVTIPLAVFTNLTRDHLDYHGDMAAYGKAKAGLFALPGVKHAIVNRDDPFGRELLGGFGKDIRVVTYGLEGGGVTVRTLKLTPRGMQLRITSPAGPAQLTSPLYGRFNAYNLLAAFATLLALGFTAADAAHRLARARAPAGRMERFGGGKGAPLVVVDYAHTPDALEKVLAALREHAKGKLACVFGCGGDRDRGKRPLMGEIAERLADRVILTDDNPRSEDGEAIVAEIRAGMKSEPRVIRDRREAILEAITQAAADDIVLVAGKGHEDYQQVGAERRPYSDRDTVRDIVGEEAS